MTGSQQWDNGTLCNFLAQFMLRFSEIDGINQEKGFISKSTLFCCCWTWLQNDFSWNSSTLISVEKLALYYHILLYASRYGWSWLKKNNLYAIFSAHGNQSSTNKTKMSASTSGLIHFEWLYSVNLSFILFQMHLRGIFKFVSKGLSCFTRLICSWTFQFNSRHYFKITGAHWL